MAASLAEELEMKSVAVMVEMMAALMVGEWATLKDGSMVESTAVTMVDDLDALMAASLAEDLEMKSAAVMVEMMAALMVVGRATLKDGSKVETTAVTMVDDLDA